MFIKCQESLVLVVGHVLEREHDVAVQQRRDVAGMAALEEAPRRADS